MSVPRCILGRQVDRVTSSARSVIDHQGLQELGIGTHFSQVLNTSIDCRVVCDLDVRKFTSRRNVNGIGRCGRCCFSNRVNTDSGGDIVDRADDALEELSASYVVLKLFGEEVPTCDFAQTVTPMCLVT